MNQTQIFLNDLKKNDYDDFPDRVDFYLSFKEASLSGLASRVGHYAHNNPVTVGTGAGALLGGGLGAYRNPKKNENRVSNSIRGAITGAGVGALTGWGAKGIIESQDLTNGLNLKDKMRNAKWKPMGEDLHTPPQPSKPKGRNWPTKPERTVVEDLNKTANALASLKSAKPPSSLGSQVKELGKHVGTLAGAGAGVGAIRATSKQEGETTGNRLKRMGGEIVDGGINGALSGAGIYGIKRFKKASLDNVMDKVIDTGYDITDKVIKPQATRIKNWATPKMQNAGSALANYAKNNQSVTGAIGGSVLGAGVGADYSHDSTGGAVGALAGGIGGAIAGPKLLKKTANLGTMIGGAIAKSPRLAGAVGGAAVGGIGNKLTGGDFSSGAIAGAAAGGIGGKRLLGAVSNKATPLLGKSVQQGAVNQLKTTRAATLAKNPASTGMRSPAAGAAAPPAAATTKPTAPMASTTPQPSPTTTPKQSPYMNVPTNAPPSAVVAPTTSATSRNAASSGLTASNPVANPFEGNAGKLVGQPGSSNGLTTFSNKPIQAGSANNNFYGLSGGMRQVPIKAQAYKAESMRMPTTVDPRLRQGLALGLR